MADPGSGESGACQVPVVRMTSCLPGQEGYELEMLRAELAAFLKQTGPIVSAGCAAAEASSHCGAASREDRWGGGPPKG